MDLRALSKNLQSDRFGCTAQFSVCENWVPYRQGCNLVPFFFDFHTSDRDEFASEKQCNVRANGILIQWRTIKADLLCSLINVFDVFHVIVTY